MSGNKNYNCQKRWDFKLRLKRLLVFHLSNVVWQGIPRFRSPVRERSICFFNSNRLNRRILKCL